MTAFQRLICFAIYAVPVVMLLLPFANSSPESLKTRNMQSSNKNSIHKQLSHRLQFEITLHGFLLWVSMGLLMPIGILAIRMSHREECGRRLRILFYVHAVSQAASVQQMLSVLLSTAGAVMSIKNFSNSFSNHHQRIGVGLYGIVWLQSLIGFLRPRRGCKGRSVWFIVHWIVGTAVSLLGIINIYTGLQAYHQKTSRSIQLWTILFTIEVALMMSFYLFQDKWEYIQKQGVILGNETMRPTTEQEISPPEKQREYKAESC
ncbi:hypothetical protein Tsubulata_012276 [Turnera subulata]|uniref:Cytochrome b561 domain-containing protein n=1 Tax=Turnera subulata TaxID=218843 RepID=A0A9Q0FTB9_9ROSI|nr:hypothetical protein Tsubulata_012276 [Turnera subulata]